MEASRHGLRTQRAADAAPAPATRAAIDHTAVRGTNGSARRRAGRQESSPSAARLEHALFALVLGCLGYVWVGALLAEATQAL
jgi:hypothetical protein